MCVSANAAWYVCGAFQNWDAGSAVQMTDKGSGIYELELNEMKGGFKIINQQAWGGIEIGAISGTKLELGVPFEVTANYASDVMFKDGDKIKNAKLSFNETTYMLTITGEYVVERPQLWLPGSWAQNEADPNRLWALNDETKMTDDGTAFTVTYNLQPGTYESKVAADGWSPQWGWYNVPAANLSLTNTPVTLDKKEGNDPANFKVDIEKAGNYVFTFNYETFSISIAEGFNPVSFKGSCEKTTEDGKTFKINYEYQTTENGKAKMIYSFVEGGDVAGIVPQFSFGDAIVNSSVIADGWMNESEGTYNNGDVINGFFYIAYAGGACRIDIEPWAYGTSTYVEPEQFADNYFVYAGGYQLGSKDYQIPTSYDSWWACDFKGDVEDSKVMGGKCLSFTGTTGGYGAFSYGIANQWGNFAFKNDVLRPLNLYFLAKCEGPETEITMVKLTAHTNEETSVEKAADEVEYDLPKDGKWHLITMNVAEKFPNVYNSWKYNQKGYVFSCSVKGVDGKEAESTVYVGPIWYAKENTIYDPGVPCEGITLNKEDITIEIGQNLQLVATVTPENTTDKVVWESGDPEVVTVSDNGLLYGVAEGGCMVTAKCGDFEASCFVMVIGKSSIVIEKFSDLNNITEDTDVRIDNATVWSTAELYGVSTVEDGTGAVQMISWDDESIILPAGLKATGTFSGHYGVTGRVFYVYPEKTSFETVPEVKVYGEEVTNLEDILKPENAFRLYTFTKSDDLPFEAYMRGEYLIIGDLMSGKAVVSMLNETYSELMEEYAEDTNKISGIFVPTVEDYDEETGEYIYGYYFIPRNPADVETESNVFTIGDVRMGDMYGDYGIVKMDNAKTIFSDPEIYFPSIIEDETGAIQFMTQSYGSIASTGQSVTGKVYGQILGGQGVGVYIYKDDEITLNTTLLNFGECDVTTGAKLTPEEMQQPENMYRLVSYTATKDEQINKAMDDEYVNYLYNNSETWIGADVFGYMFDEETEEPLPYPAKIYQVTGLNMDPTQFGLEPGVALTAIRFPSDIQGGDAVEGIKALKEAAPGSTVSVTLNKAKVTYVNNDFALNVVEDATAAAPLYVDGEAGFNQGDGITGELWVEKDANGNYLAHTGASVYDIEQVDVTKGAPLTPAEVNEEANEWRLASFVSSAENPITVDVASGLVCYAGQVYAFDWFGELGDMALPTNISSFTGIVFPMNDIEPLSLTDDPQPLSAIIAFRGIEDIEDSYVPCEGVVLDNTSLSIEVGKTATLSATLIPANTSELLYWSSDNGAIATVDEFGVVTAVAEGETVITAICGRQSATCYVTVYDPSGIETISADDLNGEAMYFNLQGVRINNPEQGVYIRVLGNKAQKVMIK